MSKTKRDDFDEHDLAQQALRDLESAAASAADDPMTYELGQLLRQAAEHELPESNQALREVLENHRFSDTAAVAGVGADAVVQKAPASEAQPAPPAQSAKSRWRLAVLAACAVCAAGLAYSLYGSGQQNPSQPETSVAQTDPDSNAKPALPKVFFRTETLTRSVPVTKTRMETRTRSLPVQRTRTETRTRQVPVQRTRNETKIRELPDGTQQSYQVAVPYTEMTTQNYSVSVPYTENVSQSYQVVVPYTENVTQTYQAEVPYTAAGERIAVEDYEKYGIEIPRAPLAAENQKQLAAANPASQIIFPDRAQSRKVAQYYLQNPGDTETVPPPGSDSSLNGVVGGVALGDPSEVGAVVDIDSDGSSPSQQTERWEEAAGAVASQLELAMQDRDTSSSSNELSSFDLKSSKKKPDALDTRKQKWGATSPSQFPEPFSSGEMSFSTSGTVIPRSSETVLSQSAKSSNGEAQGPGDNQDGEANQGGQPGEGSQQVDFSALDRSLAWFERNREANREVRFRYRAILEEMKIRSEESRRLEERLKKAEQYLPIHENKFQSTRGQSAVSTFSIDVDTASYSNMRRFLTNGQRPPANSIRIEELVNYFSYDYPQPQDDHPFSVNMEVARCPWDHSHQLLRVGLKGKEIHAKERPDTNVVYLIDVSGSMQGEDKLPLLKRGFQMLTRQLGESDRVSIVTYAGQAGVALEPTCGEETEKINAAIESLKSGGSTHGSAGIELAYQLAQQNFVEDGVNKVILATDGDLNVGVTNDDALVKLIKQKASEGVFLTVLGFGTGNLKDGKLEQLADNGNGHYAYIDNTREAHRVLVDQMSGSLVTIAKDVKIQIEFNPAEVQSYRLIGYENRVLAAKDFDDDKKDAGEIGAGHTVTAIYEIQPASSGGAQLSIPRDMKYQKSSETEEDRSKQDKLDSGWSKAAGSGELATLALRYKQPDANESKRIEFAVKNEDVSFTSASKDFRFAASVAGFGMLLRGSEHAGDSTPEMLLKIASESLGDDPSGYRSEFVDLIRKAMSIR